ncbi:MAG: cadherin-like beta sandwich domain-containing protein [Bacilli bacterium]|nr:cadherin-like beta sandwich domain-containing protein [Bacilli bacterium]MDD4796026.1 cadherin-like beta sandwich domain-containing protein [Bacilli bacterium]
MKKTKILIAIMFMLLFPITASASSGSIRATVSSTKVSLNNTFNVTVRVSADKPIGSWQFNVGYDSTKLSLQSGSTSVVDYGDGSYTSKTYTYKFRAVGLGSATVSINNAKIADYETVSYINTTAGGATVTISEPVVIVYSSNNNLSSLDIENIDISPKFDKGTLEYEAVAKAGTKEIVINAKTADSKARVSGAGTVDVIEGNNIIPLVVKAENGATKTYTINLTVPEKEPLKVGKFNINRKLPEEIPLHFIEETIIINEEEIPVLYNAKLNLTLVYASNEKKVLGFYEWNKDKVGEKFIIITNNLSSIKIDSSYKDALKGFIKSTLKIGNDTINAYQINLSSKHFIIYGTDLATGKSSFYNYDSTNQTIQMFDVDSHTSLFEQISEKNFIIYALGGALFVLALITILLGYNKSKVSKIIKNKEKKLKSNE